jgi:DNA-binding NarL/FixJ family response regulator
MFGNRFYKKRLTFVYISNAMPGIKIIMYDDSDPFRDSVCMLIKDTSDYTLLASYAHCNDVLKNVLDTQPDVVLMDIDMPGLNGIEGVGMIRQNYPSVQILILTAFDDDEKVFTAIKAGAGGYILKNTEPKNLLSAISEVYNGGGPLSPVIARKILGQFQVLPPERKKEDFRLSHREKEVLHLLVDGLSYKMIAAKLNITYDTVRAHIKKIYEKLHVASMTEAVAKAINKRLFS